MRSLAVLAVLAGCGGGSADVLPFPGDAPEDGSVAANGAQYFGTGPDDIWSRGFLTPGSYWHWDGVEWTAVADIVYGSDGSSVIPESQMDVAVAGPGLLVIAEYNREIFTLAADGTRTDLGKPMEAPYSAAFRVGGYDGVVYAFHPDWEAPRTGLAQVFRRDDAGWTELPAPPTAHVTGALWVTGPDVLWVSGNGTGVFDGTDWYEYPDVSAGDFRNLLALEPTRLAGTPRDGWAIWRMDTVEFTQTPLEDPVGDVILPRWPLAVVKDGDGVALIVDRWKDKSGGFDLKGEETIEAWPLDDDGFAGGSKRLERWTDNCKPYTCVPGGSAPAYLADGTVVAAFHDGIHLWEPL